MAEPNLGISFKLKPTYYAVFGSYTEGEVIDVQTVTNVVELKFAPSTPSIELTLDTQNKWTQKYLPEANAPSNVPVINDLDQLLIQ